MQKSSYQVSLGRSVAASERTFQRKINKVIIINLYVLKWDIKNDHVKNVYD